MSAIFLTLFLGLGVGAFGGLMVCANTTLGNFSFTEPKKDFLRCAVVALVVGAAIVGLLSISRNPRVFAAVLPVWYIAVKLCWLEIEPVEIGIVAASSILAVAVAASVAAALLN
jgi:hypothetical protein